MYWQEESDQDHYEVPEDVMDLLFSIRCPTLPVDHAWSLSEQVRQVLPWFGEEPAAGLHVIHGAESGNGWERPEGAVREVSHVAKCSKRRFASSAYLRSPVRMYASAHCCIPLVNGRIVRNDSRYALLRSWPRPGSGSGSG